MNADEWRQAGASLGPFDDTTVLLLAGDDGVALAAAAHGAASAVNAGRRVAVFDLAGALNSDAPDGLLRAFAEGRSLNVLAIPLFDGSTERFLVPRGPGSLLPSLAMHERWPRLVDGFRSTGALLILTAPSSYAGLGELTAYADRALRLSGDSMPDIAPAPAVREVEAAGEPPDDETDAEPPDDETADEFRDYETDSAWRAGPLDRAAVVAPPSPTRRSVLPRAVLPLAVLPLAAAAIAWAIWRDRTPSGDTPRAPVTAASAMTDSARFGVPDTLRVPAIVNPEDSARAAQWSVVLVATNDRAAATFRLREIEAVSAGTVAPVLLGDDYALWYKLVAGAYVDRTTAELLRASLRKIGTLDGDAGVIARLPLALRLDEDLDAADARNRVTMYLQRGVAAYAMMDEAGYAGVYAGAFASPEQAALLYAELQAANMKPVLAYRVGRTY